MTPSANPVAESLLRLIAAGAITEEALQAMTGIEPHRLRRFLDDAGVDGLSSSPQSLSPDENARISTLEAQLTAGMEIEDDERLKAVLESLTIEYHLEPEHIARLSGLSTDDITHALDDPSSMPPETKYRAATRSSYLLNAVDRARGT